MNEYEEKMDNKSILLACRKNLGFFPTSKPKDGETMEQEVFDKSCKFTVDKLRELKLRPSNIFPSNLHLLQTLIDSVRDFVVTTSESVGYLKLKEDDSEYAYSSVLVFATMSRYANLMDRKRSEGAVVVTRKRARE